MVGFLINFISSPLPRGQLLFFFIPFPFHLVGCFALFCFVLCMIGLIAVFAVFFCFVMCFLLVPRAWAVSCVFAYLFQV